MHTPVLLLLFNRPDYTSILLEKIALLESAPIYIAVDGPREGHPDDNWKTLQVKSLTDSTLFASNQVYKLYRTENLGCRHGVKNAIDWFFSQVDRGIILEDDCIPDDSFFDFCEQLLEKYSEKEHVFAISGDNFLLEKTSVAESYYFTKYFHSWGWATWKRAWEKYDFEMKSFPSFLEEDKLNYYHLQPDEKKYWEQLFDSVYKNIETVNSWAYPFAYSVWSNKAMCIAPAKNLVKNIGFEDMATHTNKVSYWYPYLKRGNITLSSHPDANTINLEADRTEFENIILHLYKPPLLRRAVILLKKLIGKFTH